MNVLKLEKFFFGHCRLPHRQAGALKLNMGQPAVSKHLNALEAEFGVALFDLSSRRTKLSPEVVKVLNVARLVVHAMKKLRVGLYECH